MPPEKAINLLYVPAKHMGYGRMGSYIAEELRAMDYAVYNDLPSPPHVRKPRSPVVDMDRDDVLTGVSNLACWCSVPTHATGWWKDQIPTIFTMWEATRLPESFRDQLHHFETVIVPSYHNVELFSRFHDNVKFVPLGVDPKVWKFTPRRKEGPFFNFLIGGSGTRKGVDLAVAAFHRLWKKDGSWGSGPIPKLILKSPRGSEFYGDRLEVHGGRLSPEAEVQLYEQAHCYLQPSRGEGFGLQPLQAIAQGIPTILTNAHGHESFAHLGIPIGATFETAAYFIFGDAEDWWAPNFDELCDRMKDVYEHYDAYEIEAAENAKIVADEWTWAHTTNKLLDVLGRERLVPYTGEMTWFTPDAKLFKIITNVNWECDIAGLSMYFEQGREYYERADVKRILFEAEVLDPACLDDDDPDASGLSEVQLARAGKYRASHSNCPHCFQKLNGVARLRDAAVRVLNGEDMDKALDELLYAVEYVNADDGHER